MLRDRDTEKWIKAAEMKVAASRKDAVVGHYVVQGAPKSPRNREYRRERDEIKRGERVQTERETFPDLSLSLYHSLWRERMERTQRVGKIRREVFPRFEARHSRSVCGSRKGYAPLCARLALPTNTIRHPQPHSCRHMTITLNPI